MNLVPSRDFGARDFDGKAGREIHDHLFLGANTGLAAIRGNPEVVEAHARYLADKKVRVDLFALREGGGIDGALPRPAPPRGPHARAGQARTWSRSSSGRSASGHPFSQGTVDSNEIWVELIARAGDRVIGRSGGIGADGTVDPYAHFINVYMLDRDGNRIDRRNPQDIFVPLYNKQIPPARGRSSTSGSTSPQTRRGPITLEAKVNYRKFDRKYHRLSSSARGKGPELPVVVMASDRVQLPVEGGPKAANEPSPIRGRPGSAGTTTGSACCSKGATRGARRASSSRPSRSSGRWPSWARPTAG